jgi:hypothetical protein
MHKRESMMATKPKNSFPSDSRTANYMYNESQRAVGPDFSVKKAGFKNGGVVKAGAKKRAPAKKKKGK